MRVFLLMVMFVNIMETPCFGTICDSLKIIHELISETDVVASAMGYPCWSKSQVILNRKKLKDCVSILVCLHHHQHVLSYLTTSFDSALGAPSPHWLSLHSSHRCSTEIEGQLDSSVVASLQHSVCLCGHLEFSRACCFCVLLANSTPGYNHLWYGEACIFAL